MKIAMAVEGMEREQRQGLGVFKASGPVLSEGRGERKSRAGALGGFKVGRLQGFRYSAQ